VLFVSLGELKQEEKFSDWATVNKLSVVGDFFDHALKAIKKKEEKD